VRPFVVVDVAELPELVVELVQGGVWLPGHPFLQGLVEPFDLVLGLWVAG
jgi:hypothetical protein